MHKYFQIFKISFQQEFAYRLNFVMWRARNVMQIILTFFLWNTVFYDPSREVFGYNKEKILTYVFGILVLRAIVLSARAVDMAGEIANGDITNYLLKPVSYFKYWFTRDIASKTLNLSFAGVEALILFLILKPNIFLQTDFLMIILFIVSVAIAVTLFFYILFLVNLVTFWMPENGWAAQFLFVVILTEFLSGGAFPIDILPPVLQHILYGLPFPYLLFFPLQVYLGKISGLAIARGILTGGLWIMVLAFLTRIIWPRGLKRYSAEGR
jgi:ABC-2 type transport system permease protein